MNTPLVSTARARHPAGGRVLILGVRHDRRRLAVDPQTDPVPVLDGIDRLDEWVDRSGSTHLVVADSSALAEQFRSRVAHLSPSDVSVHRVPDSPASLGTPALDPWGATVPPRSWSRAAKRLVDILGAAAGLAVLAPLLGLVALLILLTAGRPIFYRQERVGQGGRVFRKIKFRSMRRDAEESTGPVWAANRDERCTWIGAWLRRTNIDELPQLVNVLRGEMSLVGPRPERPIFVEQFRATVPGYDLRHAVLGGLTGWAQVHGWRGRTSLRKRLQYDLDYIRRWSFWLDVRIMLMPVQHIAWGKTSWTTLAPKRRLARCPDPLPRRSSPPTTESRRVEARNRRLPASATPSLPPRSASVFAVPDPSSIPCHRYVTTRSVTVRGARLI